jgi:hypothetical protein
MTEQIIGTGEQAVDFSPEALTGRLGAELYALAVASALSAPAPTPAKVAAVRRVLARSVAIVARQAPERASQPQLSRAA